MVKGQADLFRDLQTSFVRQNLAGGFAYAGNRVCGGGIEQVPCLATVEIVDSR